MKNLELPSGEIFNFGVEIVAHTALAALVLALGWWIWPDALFDTPIRQISLTATLQALGSILVCGLGALMLYFAAVEPAAAIFRGIKPK